MDPASMHPMDMDMRGQCVVCGYTLGGIPIGERCPECGTPVTPSSRALPTGQATASLVLGVVSMCGCLFYGVPALICGPLAMVYAKKAKRAVAAGEADANGLPLARAGRVLGLMGTILGSVMLAFIVLYFVFIALVIGAGAFGGGGGPFPVPTPAPTGGGGGVPVAPAGG